MYIIADSSCTQNFVVQDSYILVEKAKYVNKIASMNKPIIIDN